MTVGVWLAGGIPSYNPVVMAETVLNDISSLDGLLERLSPEPHLRGEEFERAAKWFLETDPAYSSDLREVWLWQEWAGRWGPDIGIDLVAETHEGKLWAIQVKCYDPESTVPKSEIDSFLAASSRPEFSHRLLISTGQITKNSESNLKDSDKSTAFLLYQGLTESPVDWLAYLDESRPVLPDKKTPRPHQEKAINDVIEGFATTDRGRLIMACGTGKTLVGVWVAERLKSARTLVLVPSLLLVNQISKERKTNSTEPFRALFVCSNQKGKNDTLASNTAELGHAVTTDPGEIQKFMDGDGASVVFSTYHSSPQIAAAQAAGAPSFDLVIADEAHHCAGKVDSAFATVLDAGRLKASRRLFMTATPRYLSRRVKDATNQADIQVSSMDETEIFGPEMHRLTFGQAIEKDLLSDYQVVIIGVTDKEVKRLTHDRTLVELLGEGPTADAESLAALVGTLKAIKNYDLNHIVTFHSRVERAKTFSTKLMEVNDVLRDEYLVSDLWTEHVSGYMPTHSRDTTLQKFRQKSEGVSLLSNARCLGEGVDVRAIDGIGFIDPRQSNIDIVQAVGRAIRKSDKGKIGTVLMPVFIDESTDNDINVELTHSRFAPIWNVLTALKAHDEALAEELDQLRRTLGQNQGRSLGSLPGQIHIDIPTEVGTNFVNALKTRVVEMTTPSWEFFFGLLQAYEEKMGHLLVPGKHMEGGYPLGTWVNHQRSRKYLLTQERIVRLDALPKWTWDPRTDVWEKSLEMVKKYIEREGHGNIPQSYVEDGIKLGSWVNTQRFDRKKAILTSERITELEGITGWFWDKRVDAWESGFAALEKYVKREGNSLVAQNHIEDGFALGVWVTSQRRNKKKLSRDFHSRLEKLPDWSWNTLESNWKLGYAALIRYVEKEGTSVVPDRYILDGFNLGTWVGTQKTRRSRMSSERISLLEELPHWTWNIRQSAWDRGFAALEKYVAREGNSLIPQNCKEDGIWLGRWVNKQRSNKINLTAERISKLDNLNGWTWRHLSDAWEVRYQLLLEYVKQEGHARVPGKYIVGDIKLGQWVSNCRFRSERLTVDQMTRLSRLPGWKWPDKK